MFEDVLRYQGTGTAVSARRKTHDVLQLSQEQRVAESVEHSIGKLPKPERENLLRRIREEYKHRTYPEFTYEDWSSKSSGEKRKWTDGDVHFDRKVKAKLIQEFQKNPEGSNEDNQSQEQSEVQDQDEESLQLGSDSDSEPDPLQQMTGKDHSSARYAIQKLGLELPDSGPSKSITVNHVHTLTTILHFQMMQRKWTGAYRTFCLLLKLEKVDIQAIWPLGVEILLQRKDSRGSKVHGFLDWVERAFPILRRTFVPVLSLSGTVFRRGSRTHSPVFVIVSLWEMVVEKQLSKVRDSLTELMLSPPYSSDGVFPYMMLVCLVYENAHLAAAYAESDIDSLMDRAADFGDLADDFALLASKDSIRERVMANDAKADQMIGLCDESSFEYPKEDLVQSKKRVLEYMGITPKEIEAHIEELGAREAQLAEMETVDVGSESDEELEVAIKRNEPQSSQKRPGRAVAGSRFPPEVFVKRYIQEYGTDKLPRTGMSYSSSFEGRASRRTPGTVAAPQKPKVRPTSKVLQPRANEHANASQSQAESRALSRAAESQAAESQDPVTHQSKELPQVTENASPGVAQTSRVAPTRVSKPPVSTPSVSKPLRNSVFKPSILRPSTTGPSVSNVPISKPTTKVTGSTRENVSGASQKAKTQPAPRTLPKSTLSKEYIAQATRILSRSRDAKSAESPELQSKDSAPSGHSSDPSVYESDTPGTSEDNANVSVDNSKASRSDSDEFHTPVPQDTENRSEREGPEEPDSEADGSESESDESESEESAPNETIDARSTKFFEGSDSDTSANFTAAIQKDWFSPESTFDETRNTSHFHQFSTQKYQNILQNTSVDQDSLTFAESQTPNISRFPESDSETTMASPNRRRFAFDRSDFLENTDLKFFSDHDSEDGENEPSEKDNEELETFDNIGENETSNSDNVSDGNQSIKDEDEVEESEVEENERDEESEESDDSESEYDTALNTPEVEVKTE